MLNMRLRFSKELRGAKRRRRQRHHHLHTVGTLQRALHAKVMSVPFPHHGAMGLTPPLSGALGNPHPWVMVKTTLPLPPFKNQNEIIKIKATMKVLMFVIFTIVRKPMELHLNDKLNND